MTDRSRLGGVLEAHMARQGIRSQSELARRARLHPSYISRLIRGERFGRSDDTLARVAQALKTTATQLRREAGLDQAERRKCTVQEALLDDPDLTTAQRRQLLQLYELFVSGGATDGSARR